MTRAEAHAMLNAARDGLEVSRASITAALRETGDIDWGQVVREHRAVGSWERLMVPSMLRPAEPFDALQGVL